MSPWRDGFFALTALADVGPLLFSADPVWIWSRDGDRVLWSNPAGGARLGSGSFAELSSRRWPAGHPLRRTIGSLSRALPGSGSLARLRLQDDLRAVPSACRCHHVRAAGARGILVRELDGASLRSDPALLASFLADVRFGAAILDDAGVVVAETSAGLSALIDSAAPSIPLVESGRALRLFLLEEAGDGAPVAPVPASPEMAPEAAPPLPRQVSAEDDRRPRSAPPAAKAPQPSTAKEPRGAERPRAAPPIKPVPPLGPQGRTSSEEETEKAAPAVEQLSPQSITAGRVARELSRKSVRFLWQSDAADRFLFVSPGLAQVVGRNAEIMGERWQEISARLRLDPTGRIAAALRQRDTWSGLTAWWPIEGSNVRVPVELTALPVFGLDHSFQGYRGFGVLRPAEALMPAAYEARFGAAAAAPVEQVAPYEEAVSGVPAKVVPIRADLEHMSEHVRLTSHERSAFEEIAAALRSRIGVNVDRSDEQVSATPVDNGPSTEPDPASAGLEGGPIAPIVPGKQDQPEGAAGDSGEPEGMPVSSSDATEGAVPSARRDPVERAEGDASLSLERTSVALRARLADAERRLHEMAAILDTATDGVVIMDATGMIESVNASAEAIFGLEAHEMEGRPFDELLTPESRELALDYLSGLRDSGVASLLNEGREVEARAGSGSIPLFITMGRISSEEGARFCAVLRDITHWKRTEGELLDARRAAEAASGQKSEFLARVSHEIRTPLNAIIGFAEVMVEERFGPIENQRYREYLRDIRTSGEHVVSLVNDLLDISKIEAGKLDLDFTAVPLNELVRESIALMQPQSNRAHVVLRMSLSRDVPSIVADHRTLRQIVLNLLSNSVKFTGPGGQVIASTSLADSGEALLRIRDTGEGMSDAELARALEPFRQLSTATIADRSGTGLGLPLTKALVEANRASLSIRSARGEGTVVTVTFPPTRVLSE